MGAAQLSAHILVSVADDQPLFGTQAVFKWKGEFCLDGEAHLCCLDHGGFLVMDGQCQDEFLHCTDPDQERINVKFRWIWQHTASCPLRTGVVCCLSTCAQGSSAAVTRIVGYCAFWGFWVLLGVLCTWWVLALLVLPLISAGLGFRRCAHRWTRQLGGGRRRVHWYAQNCSSCFQVIVDSIVVMLYVLAFAGLPSLQGENACMVLWIKGACWGNCRQKVRKTSFSPNFSV